MLVNSQPIFNFFTVRFSSKFAAKHSLNSLHLTGVAALPCQIIMSENQRQSQNNAVINNKSQCTVVTYLGCGGIVDNQMKTGLLMSLPVKKIIKKSVDIWHSYGQTSGLCRALSSS